MALDVGHNGTKLSAAETTAGTATPQPRSSPELPQGESSAHTNHQELEWGAVFVGLVPAITATYVLRLKYVAAAAPVPANGSANSSACPKAVHLHSSCPVFYV